MRIHVHLLVFAILLIVLVGCSEKKRPYIATPVDKMMRDLSNEKMYAIVLYDMELDEHKHIYKHKYRITKNIQDSTTKPITTEWIAVTEEYFAQNIDNMGLELASKSLDGSVHKTPSPPGFNNFVGNKGYGSWKQDAQGNSFWEYYGQYMFMNRMLSASQPRIYQSTYQHYDTYRTNPQTRYKPYYGSKDNAFGTNSEAAKKVNPSFFERKQQQQQFSTFKQKVSNNPRYYNRATERNPSTTYNRSTTSSNPSTTNRSTTSSSKPSTTSSSTYKPSTTSNTPSRTSTPAKAPSSTRSSSSSSSPSRSSSSSSAPSRSSSSSSSRRK